MTGMIPLEGPLRDDPDAVRVVVIGDVLLEREITGSREEPIDIRAAGHGGVAVVGRSVQERPGGAAAVAALLARVEPRAHLTLVAPLGTDDASRRIARALQRAGVQHAAVHHTPPTPTTTPTVLHVVADGRTVLRLELPSANRASRSGADAADGHAALDGTGASGAADRERYLSNRAVTALQDADVVIAVDRGHGLLDTPDVARALQSALASGTPVVWSPRSAGAVAPAGVVMAGGGRMCSPAVASACAARGAGDGCESETRHAVDVSLVLARGAQPGPGLRHPRCGRVPA